MVCRVNKSLYGLKQASRSWFKKISTSIQQDGFHQSRASYSLFTKISDNSFTAILIYVDDMIITSNDDNAIAALKECHAVRSPIWSVQVRTQTHRTGKTSAYPPEAILNIIRLNEVDTCTTRNETSFTITSFSFPKYYKFHSSTKGVHLDLARSTTPRRPCRSPTPHRRHLDLKRCKPQRVRTTNNS